MCFSLIPKKQSILLGVVACIFTSIPAISLAMEDAPQLQKGHVAAVKAFLDHLTDNAGPIQPGVKEAWTKPYTALPINSNADSTSTVYVEPSHTLALKKDASPMKYPGGRPRYGPSSHFEGGGPSIERGSSHGLPSLSTSNSDPLLKTFLQEFTRRLKLIDSLTPTGLQKVKHPSYHIGMYSNDQSQFIRILNTDGLIPPSDELKNRYWELIQSIYGLKMRELSKPEGKNSDHEHEVYFENIFNWVAGQIFSPDKSLPICGFPHLRLAEREFTTANLGEIQVKMLDYWHGSRSSSVLASDLINAYEKNLNDFKSTYRSQTIISPSHFVHMDQIYLQEMFSILKGIESPGNQIEESTIKKALKSVRKTMKAVWKGYPKGIDSKLSMKAEHPILPIGISHSSHVQILKSQTGEPVGLDMTTNTMLEIFKSAALLHLKVSKHLPSEFAKRVGILEFATWFSGKVTIQEGFGLPFVGFIPYKIDSWHWFKFSPFWISLIQYISASKNHTFSNLKDLKAFVLLSWYQHIFTKNELTGLVPILRRSSSSWVLETIF